MALDERFDERAERKDGEVALSGVFQSEANQLVRQSLPLHVLVDLGVNESDQARPCTVGREANHLTVERELIALALWCVGDVGLLRHSHARSLDPHAYRCPLRQMARDL